MIIDPVKGNYILYYNYETCNYQHRPAETYQEVIEQWGNDNRNIRFDEFSNTSVSTVFLVFDHSLGLIGKDKGPILYETLVSGGKYCQWMERYHTYEDALEGHNRICEMVDYISINRNEKINKLLE